MDSRNSRSSLWAGLAHKSSRFMNSLGAVDTRVTVDVDEPIGSTHPLQHTPPWLRHHVVSAQELPILPIHIDEVRPMRLTLAALSIGLLCLCSGCVGLRGPTRSGSSEGSTVCRSCRGSGRCSYCNGTGRSFGTGESHCSACGGSGVCIGCGGSGKN